MFGSPLRDEIVVDEERPVGEQVVEPRRAAGRLLQLPVPLRERRQREKGRRRVGGDREYGPVDEDAELGVLVPFGHGVAVERFERGLVRAIGRGCAGYDERQCECGGERDQPPAHVVDPTAKMLCWRISRDEAPRRMP